MRGSKQQYANKNLNAMAARPNAPTATLSKTTTSGKELIAYEIFLDLTQSLVIITHSSVCIALRGNLMVIQGTIKVSKPVGAAAIPVPPVITPSLKKEKSIAGGATAWKETTGMSKSLTNLDNHLKLDKNKSDNPWTESISAVDPSPVTRDIDTSVKNASWIDDNAYNNSRRDTRINHEYNDSSRLHKVRLFSLPTTRVHAGYYLFNTL